MIQIPGILLATARKLTAGLLGLGMLWQVAEHAGWGEGEVVVHVAAAPDATVRIDGEDYSFDPWPGDPIVCNLRPGTHTMTLTREGQTLHNETFLLDPNAQVVLTAWDQTPQIHTSNPPVASIENGQARNSW